MVAEAASCSCPECGVVCEGQFDGCSGVWLGTPVVREPSVVPSATVADPAEMAPVSTAEPIQEELLRLLNDSLVELTQEFRAVATTVQEQGQQTRALLEAQTDATGMLLEAIRMLPRQLEAATVDRSADEDEDSMAEPVEILRPEVVRFDSGGDDASSDPWPPPRSRWSQG